MRSFPRRALGAGAFVAVCIATMTAGSTAAYAAPHATPRAATGGPHAASRQTTKVHAAHGWTAGISHGTGASKKNEANTAAPAPPDATATPSTASLLADNLPPSPQPAPAVGAASAASTVHTVSSPAAAGSPPVAPAPSVIRDEPMILSSGGWQGVSLQAAVDLRVPILFGAAVLLFVLLQALVDRRDPKVSRAPERGDDDTVGFS